MALARSGATPAPRAQRAWGELRAALRAEPWLAGLGVVLLAMVPPTVAAALFDGREYLGIDIWLKPLKFELALAIYAFTLAFYARWLPTGTLGRRWYRLFTAAVIFATLFEIAAIAGSAAEGTGSHFNFSTPFHTAVYALRGVFATLLTSMALVYGILIARSDRAPRDPALKAGLVSGLVLTFVLTMVFAGYMSGHGSHFVGGSGTDAGGVAVMGWSRDGGDLRVAHFFGTHAMHAVPLVGLFAGRWLEPRVAVATTWGFAAAWAAVSAALFLQALAGVAFVG
jgi:hypothetical protein